MDGIFFAMLLLAGGTWFAGLLGALGAWRFKKGGLAAGVLVPGFAAGVILSVSFVELLHPAIHLAEGTAWIIVPGAFALGFLSAFLFAVYIEKSRLTCKRGVTLLAALAAHSVPEGLALGVLLGTLGRGFEPERLLVFAPVFLAVGLHKLPEATAISAAFCEDGVSKFASFLLGQASGILTFAAGVAGFLIAVNFDGFMPFAMAFAGGAMLRVATGELIPLAKAKSLHLCAVGLCLGIFLMLFVDTTLHLHHNGSECSCLCDGVFFQRSGAK